MYYSNLLNIKRGNRVLEIGPGSAPFWRSNVLADKYINGEYIPKGNFGNAASISTNGKPLFEIKDNILPFEDESFDYIICSHVCEHVKANELRTLLQEIFRVAPKAYIEFPAPLYEYIYDIEAHENFMDIDGTRILCLPKKFVQSMQSDPIKLIRHSNSLFSLRIGKKGKQAFTTGKVFFRSQWELIIFEDETLFIEAVIKKTYIPPPPNFILKAHNLFMSKISRYIM